MLSRRSEWPSRRFSIRSSRCYGSAIEAKKRESSEKKDWVASHVADSDVRTSANLGLAAFSDAVAGLLWVNV